MKSIIITTFVNVFGRLLMYQLGCGTHNFNVVIIFQTLLLTETDNRSPTLVISTPTLVTRTPTLVTRHSPGFKLRSGMQF